MKNLVLLASIIFAFVFGLVSTVIYYESEIQNINEDIVSKEVELSFLASSTKIPCEKLLRLNGWVAEDFEGYSVFWRFTTDSAGITKVIIDENLSSIVETVDNECP